MDDKAYWMSPNGDMLPVPLSHISEVISNSERFELTRQYLVVGGAEKDANYGAVAPLQ